MTTSNIQNITTVNPINIEDMMTENGFQYSKLFSDEETQFFVSKDAEFKAEFRNGVIKVFRTNDARNAIHEITVKKED